MASIRKRGDSFTITAYLGYDESGRQRKKTTTYRPPDGVTPGKAEKLAKAFAVQWEESVKGHVSLDENRTFAELAEWYYTDIAPSVIKPLTLQKARTDLQNHVMDRLGHEKLKNITPAMLDRLFRDLQTSNNSARMYRLKDRQVFEGIKRCAFTEKAGISLATVARCLRGESLYRKSVEKIAAALNRAVFFQCETRELNRFKHFIDHFFQVNIIICTVPSTPCNRHFVIHHFENIQHDVTNDSKILCAMVFPHPRPCPFFSRFRDLLTEQRCIAKREPIVSSRLSSFIRFNNKINNNRSDSAISDSPSDDSLHYMTSPPPNNCMPEAKKFF